MDEQDIDGISDELRGWIDNGRRKSWQPFRIILHGFKRSPAAIEFLVTQELLNDSVIGQDIVRLELHRQLDRLIDYASSDSGPYDNEDDTNEVEIE